jgi:hypothetical protein
MTCDVEREPPRGETRLVVNVDRGNGKAGRVLLNKLKKGLQTTQRAERRVSGDPGLARADREPITFIVAEFLGSLVVSAFNNDQ